LDLFLFKYLHALERTGSFKRNMYEAMILSENGEIQFMPYNEELFNFLNAKLAGQYELDVARMRYFHPPTASEFLKRLGAAIGFSYVIRDALSDEELGKILTSCEIEEEFVITPSPPFVDSSRGKGRDWLFMGREEMVYLIPFTPVLEEGGEKLFLSCDKTITSLRKVIHEIYGVFIFQMDRFDEEKWTKLGGWEGFKRNDYLLLSDFETEEGDGLLSMIREMQIEEEEDEGEFIFENYLTGLGCGQGEDF
jgi:hypothetical protein